MTTLSTTQARKKFDDLVNCIAGGHRVFRIRHQAGDAVLMSEADYDSLLETLELLSVPGFRASIRRSLRQAARGQTRSLEDVFGASK